mgnify:CR=1 FL=1
MAAYGAMLREHKTPKQAQAYLAQLFLLVVSQDTSARNALSASSVTSSSTVTALPAICAP